MFYNNHVLILHRFLDIANIGER